MSGIFAALTQPLSSNISENAAAISYRRVSTHGGWKQTSVLGVVFAR